MKKSGKRKQPQFVAVDATELSLEWLRIVLRAPLCAFEITVGIRSLLEQIRTETSNRGRLMLKEFMMVSRPEDHHPTSNFFLNIVAVLHYLKSGESPQKLFSPLFGGEAALQHILKCRYCLAAVRCKEFADGVQLQGDANQVAASAGIRVVDPNADTIAAMYSPPRVN